jgi:uncharacterized protein (TIGR02246 family)
MAIETIETNKALAWRIYEAFNARDLNAVDALFAADMTDHTAGGSQREGAEGIRQAWHFLFSKYPEVRAEVQEVLAEGDQIATRVLLRNIGGAQDVAAQQATFLMMEFARIADGKVVELWNIVK